MEKKYTNERVRQFVEKSLEDQRVVPWRGHLYQNYLPIYFEASDLRPANLLDFRANFFVPTKHFLGRYYDTMYFNVTMIWAMTIILFVTLYFDLLKRLVNALERRRKYRRRNMT